MPKITNKFPEDEIPLDGFLKSFEVEKGLIILENNLKTINKIDFVVTTGGKLLLGHKHLF